MAVNHFAPFLLTNRLEELLTAAPFVRVVTVSSMTHSGASLNMDDLLLERGWDSYGAYATSKLANILFTRRLAENLRKTRVTANSLHPGVVATKLLRAGFSNGGASIEDGAKTSVYLVDDKRVAGVTGKYFVDCREQHSSKYSLESRLAQQLWERSIELLLHYL